MRTAIVVMALIAAVRGYAGDMDAVRDSMRDAWASRAELAAVSTSGDQQDYERLMRLRTQPAVEPLPAPVAVAQEELFASPLNGTHFRPPFAWGRSPIVSPARDRQQAGQSC